MHKDIITTQILFTITFISNAQPVFFLIYRDAGIAKRFLGVIAFSLTFSRPRSLIDFFLSDLIGLHNLALHHTDLVRTHEIYIKDITFHGRNNLAHDSHNPGHFQTTVARLRFVMTLICQTEFSIGTAREGR